MSAIEESAGGAKIRGVQAVRMMGAAVTAEAFWEAANRVAAKVALLQAAAEQVQGSGRLAAVLEHFMNMAKLLDDGSESLDRGLSPDALMQLAAREAQPGATVLQIFVETCYACGEESMLLFSRDLPDLHAASRLDPRAVQAEVANLSTSLKHIEFELTAVAWDAVREDEERMGRSQQRRSTNDVSIGNEEDVPALPPPVTFLKAGEGLGLHGGVAKKGLSIISPFRNRLLVLTGRRLLYFSQRGGAPGVIWLTRDSVCGLTHGGVRFELSAQPGRGGVRRYYFEPLLFLPATSAETSIIPQPSAQKWVDAITAAINALNTPVTLASAPSSPAGHNKFFERLSPAPKVAVVSKQHNAIRDLCPPLPKPSSFLYDGEKLVLHGPVTKQGPSKFSLFKPRLLVLTSRRILYFSSNPKDKQGVILLTPDAVAGVTHQGKRFELSAFPLGEQTLRRYYFEVELIGRDNEPTAQGWVSAIAKSVNELWSPPPADSNGESSSSVAAEAQPLGATPPLLGSPGAVTPQMAIARRGSGDVLLSSSVGNYEDDDDEVPFEEQLQAFINDLERFLNAAKPAQEQLESDALAMVTTCEAISAQFDCQNDGNKIGELKMSTAARVSRATVAEKSKGGIRATSAPMPISGARVVFAGLVKFAKLLAKARFKWEANHGIGLAEVYSDMSKGESDSEEDDEDDEDPLIERLAHYISIGVTFEQLERDLAVKGVADGARLLHIAGTRAHFELPEDVEENDLVRLGIDPEQAELWKTEYDELEDDDNFIHYVEMMNRQVPHAAVAAKLERDGEDEETIGLFSQLYLYRKNFGPPDKALDEVDDE